MVRRPESDWRPFDAASVRPCGYSRCRRLEERGDLEGWTSHDQSWPTRGFLRVFQRCYRWYDSRAPVAYAWWPPTVYMTPLTTPAVGRLAVANPEPAGCALTEKTPRTLEVLQRIAGEERAGDRLAKNTRQDLLAVLGLTSTVLNRARPTLPDIVRPSRSETEAHPTGFHRLAPR